MRPVPIDTEIARQLPGTRTVIGPPGNQLESTIAPVEAMVEQLPAGRAFTVRCVLEEGDLERLAAGECVHITMLGHIVPFSVGVGL